MVELNTKSDPRKFYGNGFSLLLCSLEKNINGNGHTKIRSGRDPDRKIYRVGPCKLPRARNRQKQTHNTLTYISYTQHTHTHTHTYRQSHKQAGRKTDTNKQNYSSQLDKGKETDMQKQGHKPISTPHIHMNIHIYKYSQTRILTHRQICIHVLFVYTKIVLSFLVAKALSFISQGQNIPRSPFSENKCFVFIFLYKFIKRLISVQIIGRG